MQEANLIITPQERRRQQDFMKHFPMRRVIPVICYHMKL